MKFYLAIDYNDVSERAYNYIKSEIQKKPNITLGLATGSTPIGLYKLMIHDYKRGNVSYNEVKTVNLDEYVGLAPDHPQSYRYFMNNTLFNHIDINLDNTRVPLGIAHNLEQECKSYSEHLSKNTPDIQILGIGTNGHIAFNEPGTSFNSITHIVDLKDSTISDNARFFDSIDEVPKQAITMGIKDIMRAKTIILLATGASKSEAIYNALRGPITEDCPASILQTHKNVVVFADQAASYIIKNKN